MSKDQPNMVDAAIALPEAGNVLSLIADHMEAEAKHRSDLIEAWLVQAKAEAKAMEDGVKFALALSDFGGTTAQYEGTLERMRMAVHHATADGPIRRWYIEAFTQDLFAKDTHPYYIPTGGEA